MNLRNKVSSLHDFMEQSFCSAWLYGTKFLLCMTLRNKIFDDEFFTNLIALNTLQLKEP